jgi:O-methyltransferase involved in polyketide biosynthesis
MVTVGRETGPFLFLAEGVFMYLEYEDVRPLVLVLQKTFPVSELLCGMENSFRPGPFKKNHRLQAAEPVNPSVKAPCSGPKYATVVRWRNGGTGYGFSMNEVILILMRKNRACSGC